MKRMDWDLIVEVIAPVAILSFFLLALVSAMVIYW